MTDIDAIRRREWAATPGPWEHRGNDGLVWPPRVGDPVSGSTETADAEFIAHARTDIPTLLAELDAYAIAMKRLHAELDEVRKQAHRDATEHQQIVRAKNELANERDAMRAVVDAAKAWRDLPGSGPLAAALAAAVDALEAAQERANCPGCRAEQAGAS